MDLNQNPGLNISKGDERGVLVQIRIKFCLILGWNWSQNVEWAVRALWDVQNPEPGLDLHRVPRLPQGTGWLWFAKILLVWLAAENMYSQAIGNVK